MIDERNIYDYLLEPSGHLRFRTLELSIQHVVKHVFVEEEKWGKLKGF